MMDKDKVDDPNLEQNSGLFLKINRFQVEENAVFIDFNPQQIAKSLEHYKSLNFYHRFSLVKNLDAIRQICNGNDAYIHFLKDIAIDSEQIQSQLIEFLRNLFVKRPATIYKLEFIQPLQLLISGKYLEIKQKSCSLLSQICQITQIQDRRDIIKFALQLQKSQDQQNKIISIQLIAKMTPNMNQQQIQQFFKNQYTKIYKESSVRIKKEIIYSSSIIAKSVGKQFLNKQIIEGFFAQKSKELVWGVRKACVEILPRLVILTEIRKEFLSAILLNFTKDGNKIVKIAAFKIIPEFIANYSNSKVPQKLFEIYINLIDHEINQSLSRQNQILQKISFYYPGVMQTVGASKWNQMKKLFNRLLFNRSIDVRMPIASSLHQISRIIGPQLSKEYMFTALDNILKDNSDLLKLTAISHLSQFVQLFEKTTRQNLIDVFLVLQKDPKKWRVRFQIAHQLNTLSKIYETQTVFKYIFPISLKLCNDNVTQVRLEAAKQIFYVIDNMKQIEDFQQMAIESVIGYGLSEKYTQRQTFALMIRNLYKLTKNKQKLLNMVISIARDPIINVRIALAISFRQILKDDQQHYSTYKQIIQILKNDEQDVHQYFL